MHSKVESRGLLGEARGSFKIESEDQGEMDKNNEQEGARRTTEGILFLENGIHEFRLGNEGLLRIYAGNGTPYPYGDETGMEWAFGHSSNTDIYNPLGQGISYAQQNTTTTSTLIPDNANLDIIMTHGPPLNTAST